MTDAKGRPVLQSVFFDSAPGGRLQAKVCGPAGSLALKLHRLGFPDLAGVLGDRAVGGERAHGCDVV